MNIKKPGVVHCIIDSDKEMLTALTTTLDNE